MGGLCLGAILRLCWVLLLLWLAPPADPSRLQGQAVALAMGTMAMAGFTLTGFFYPRTAYTPPRAVIAGVALVCTFYVVVAMGLLLQ